MHDLVSLSLTSTVAVLPPSPCQSIDTVCTIHPRAKRAAAVVDSRKKSREQREEVDGKLKWEWKLGIISLVQGFNPPSERQGS